MKLQPLSSSQVDEFREQGFLLVRSFYDVEADIHPIQRAIHRIIGLVGERHGLSVAQKPFTPVDFDSGYDELIRADRSYGGEVYDAVKQIPAFMRLVSLDAHEALFMQLRATDAAGLAAGGYGIRIDNPAEERFRASWHQEYTGQLRSLDGIGLWIPLQPVTPALGPVEFCVGSHRQGLFKVRLRDDRNPEKTGAYAQMMDDEQALTARYQQAAPLSGVGDLLILDFLVLHQSGHNRSTRARWSMQARYFNFREPTGMRIGWCGCYAMGKSLNSVHPELVADGTEGNSRG